MNRTRATFLAAATLIATSAYVAPVSADEAPLYPTVTSITLGVTNIIVTGDACTDIPVMVTFDLNGTTVEQVSIPIESKPHEMTVNYGAGFVPVPGASTASGTLHYCGAYEGVGTRVVGDILIAYRSPDDASTVIDPMYTTFDGQQASTASLSAHRVKATKHHPTSVKLRASERYIDALDGVRKVTTDQPATLQRSAGGQWINVSSKKPSVSLSAASFTVTGSKKHTYRVTFPGSDSIASATSKTVTI
jgi:hypothetical protein